jgi:hypothetical protein
LPFLFNKNKNLNIIYNVNKMENQQKIDYFILILLSIVAIFSSSSLISKYNNGIVLLELTDHYELLLRMALIATKNYILTGDVSFKNKYLELIRIKNGEGEWDDLFPLLSDKLKNNNSSSAVLFKKFCNETAFKLYEEFSIIERKILWYSILVINSTDGLIDDKDEMKAVFDSDKSLVFVTFKKEADKKDKDEMRTKNIKMLFGSEFLSTVADLENKVNEFKIYNNSIISNSLKGYKNLLYLDLILLLAYIIYMIIRK